MLRIVFPILAIAGIAALFALLYPKVKLWFAQRSINNAKKLAFIKTQVDSLSFGGEKHDVSKNINNAGLSIRDVCNSVDDQIKKL